jgi:hypothetical protein
LQHAKIDAVVQTAVAHGAKRRHVRLPLPRIVADEEVVTSAAHLLAGEDRVLRGAVEDQRDFRRLIRSEDDLDRTRLERRGHASLPRDEGRRAAPLPAILDEVDGQPGQRDRFSSNGAADRVRRCRPLISERRCACEQKNAACDQDRCMSCGRIQATSSQSRAYVIFANPRPQSLRGFFSRSITGTHPMNFRKA